MKFDQAQALARTEGTVAYNKFRTTIKRFARGVYLTIAFVLAGLFVRYDLIGSPLTHESGGGPTVTETDQPATPAPVVTPAKDTFKIGSGKKTCLFAEGHASALSHVAWQASVGPIETWITYENGLAHIYQTDGSKQKFKPEPGYQEVTGDWDPTSGDGHNELKEVCIRYLGENATFVTVLNTPR